ncbi:MAG: hypothetical protein RML46_06620 [Anaerolineae bacterium]|nr:hypothetical protein [Anaerolineae bacterium]
MALIFFAGFDAGGTLEQYEFLTSGTASVDTGGRRGGRCMRLGGGSAYYVHASANGVVTGFALSLLSLPSSDTVLIAWMDGGTTQVDLRVTPNGAIRATRNGTNLGVSAANVLTLQSLQNYVFLEARVVISSSAGSVQVRVNNNTVLNLTNVNTQATANNTVNRVEWRTVTIPTLIDDIHHYDTTGTDFNTFEGDMPVVLAPVSGPGDYAQWTPNGAPSNYDCVDDIPPDGDATFNSTQQAGRVDSFVHAPVTGLAAVRAVKVMSFARKDDAAARSLELGVVIGGTFYSGGQVALPDNYVWKSVYFTANPATNSAWTLDALNNAQIAYRSAS